MAVLFTFLAERYERKNVLLTSNLLFRDWGRIFKDPMTTAAAAIDRLVHDSVIIEMNGPSIREQAARLKGAITPDTSTGTPVKDERTAIKNGEI